MIFAYDQARDAQRVYAMIHSHNLKIVGPETDIPGVFNGPLLYYFLLPLDFISNFNPNVVALGFILVNLTGVFFLYSLGTTLFKNKYIGYIAAFLWTISYAQANFARFISNASPMSIASLIYFWGFAKYYFDNKKWGLIAAAIGYAIAVQMNFYLVYLIIFFPLFEVMYQTKKRAYRWYTYAVATGAVLLSSFLIAELKFKFSATQAMLAYFERQTTASTVMENVERYIARIADAWHYSFFSFNLFIGVLIGIGIISTAIALHKSKKPIVFLLIWCFSTLPLFGFHSGVLNGTVINSSIFPAFTLMYAAGIYAIWQQRNYRIIAVGILVVFFISNLQLMAKERFASTKLFALQPLTYKVEKDLVDYTYQASNKKPFSICAVSNPLFINTLWSQLYMTYGKQQYRYTPTWAGQKQFLNVSYLPYDINHEKIRYLILEPMGGIPEFAKKVTIYVEDKHSKLIEEKQFGDLIVQKRQLLEPGEEPKSSQTLTPYEIGDVIRVSTGEPRYSCYVNY